MHTDAEITMEMLLDSPRIKVIVPPRKHTEDPGKEVWWFKHRRKSKALLGGEGQLPRAARMLATHKMSPIKAGMSISVVQKLP